MFGLQAGAFWKHQESGAAASYPPILISTIECLRSFSIMLTDKPLPAGQDELSVPFCGADSVIPVYRSRGQ